MCLFKFLLVNIMLVYSLLLVIIQGLEIKHESVIVEHFLQLYLMLFLKLLQGEVLFYNTKVYKKNKNGIFFSTFCCLFKNIFHVNNNFSLKQKKKESQKKLIKRRWNKFYVRFLFLGELFAVFTSTIHYIEWNRNSSKIFQLFNFLIRNTENFPS